MQLQQVIEQTAKEYLLYKNIFETKKKEASTKKEGMAKKALEIEDPDEFFSEYFKVFGEIELLAIDVNQIKIKLYHYIKLAEDLVEIPQEIKNLTEDYTPAYLFSIEGEIVNKPLYEQYKENYIKASKEMMKMNAK